MRLMHTRVDDIDTKILCRTLCTAVITRLHIIFLLPSVRRLRPCLRSHSESRSFPSFRENEFFICVFSLPRSFAQRHAELEGNAAQ